MRSLTAAPVPLPRKQDLARDARPGGPRLLTLGRSGRTSFGLSWLILLLCCLPPIDAAIVPLGHGLRYLRVDSAVQSAAELRDALQEPSALIVDLRYTADEAEGRDGLRVLSDSPVQAKLYVLVSPETPRAVADTVRAAGPHAVVLGVKGSRPEPQVIVEQAPQDDRVAYEALAKGIALSDLISGKIDKERFDEASLVQEFRNGNHDARPPAKAADGAKPTRRTDRVLQRAVHLHRALQALKRG